MMIVVVLKEETIDISKQKSEVNRLKVKKIK